MSIELINIMSQDNYNQFNIDLAHSVGLEEAVYLNQLILISSKAKRKNKLGKGYFKVDREYVKSRTTLPVAVQRDMDKTLEPCGILEIVDGGDTIKLNLINLYRLIGGDTSIIEGYDKDVKKKKKALKAEAIREQLKKNITTDNAELHTAYCEWIDSVSNKRGYMDKKAVIEGQKLVSNYCGEDIKKALKIISIATVNSYIDMGWALDTFKHAYAKSFEGSVPVQDISNLGDKVY